MSLFHGFKKTKTRIVCTIGPASWEPTIMQGMIEAGMDIARVNGAFADTSELDRVKNLVRQFSNDVALMLDVKGPEVRLNKFPENINIKEGEEVIIGNTEQDLIHPANYTDLYKILAVGQKILLGDGETSLEVTEIIGDKVKTIVRAGLVIKPGQSVHLPGADYISHVLTDRDKELLTHAMNTGWEFVSASFIQNNAAITQVREFMGKTEMKLIAKIEDALGVQNIDEILPSVDGIMIARGGLGVDLGLEKVPIIQRDLLKKCAEAGKPVITATQMLESMNENPRPTRAEASDVVTAVLLRTDALMLSSESTMGKYPVEAVEFLTSAALEAEKYLMPKIVKGNCLIPSNADAISKAAAQMCIKLGDEIAAVVVVSQSGRTAGHIGRHSIKQPIYAFTSDEFSARCLSVYKGITKAFVYNGFSEQANNDRDLAINSILTLVREHKLVEQGNKILLIGRPPKNSGITFPSIFEVAEV